MMPTYPILPTAVVAAAGEIPVAFASASLILFLTAFYLLWSMRDSRRIEARAVVRRRRRGFRVVQTATAWGYSERRMLDESAVAL